MDGRYVPILPEAEDVILEYYENLKEAGIESEWLFSREDGTPIKNSQYDLFFVDSAKNTTLMLQITTLSERLIILIIWFPPGFHQLIVQKSWDILLKQMKGIIHSRGSITVI